MNRLEQLEVYNKTVLVRSSVNVPISEIGEIFDDFRLQKAVPTIVQLTKKGAKVVLLGHLGRPKGVEESLSLKVVASRLEELLGKDITFVRDNPKEAISQMNPGDIVLLENLRFHKGEVENDEAFAKELAELGDIYVNDAFSASHRKHASIVALAKLLPSAIGLSFEQEISALRKIMQTPEHPFLVIIGGSKVKTKTAFLKAIAKKADTVLLGNLVGEEVKKQELQFQNVVGAVDGVLSDGEEFDIGEKTIKLFEEKIKEAKTIFWIGPLGKIEQEQYQKGSLAIVNAVLKSKAFSVAGGGELSAFLGEHGFRERFSHVSTGGGSLLAFLSGEVLPGLQALE